jgi:hypothetical protein
MARIESMMIYLLETQLAAQEVKPTLEQAKTLEVMGLPPWPTMRRDTNKFQVWRDMWERRKLILAAQAAIPEGDDHASQA